MIGQRLGNWRIDKELGRGGMGYVFLAHEEMDGQPAARRAALKVLSAELANDSGFLSRFQREIDALRQLDHPNIVRFYDSGAQDGRYFYVMEYVDGRNFEELVLERGRLPWEEVLDLALQVSPALKHAHDRGIIHRDLKPSNLLRATQPSAANGFGTIKLTDFGIAHVFARPHLTATGGIIGTAEYLSPEQAAGKPVTKRSDLYSLGVVLYTLLTGRNPFQGETVVDLLQKHRFSLFDQPRKIVPEIPYELDEIICQLLEKDPANRPGDGMVLFKKLDTIRRKQDRKQSQVVSGPMLDLTRLEKPPAVIPDNPGPATLMSQLMRQELVRQNLGGPLSRFFHRPAVLSTLFVLCVGLIIWGLWPSSAESIFRRGEELMQSDDPKNWEKAVDDYFGPLDTEFPDHPYKDQVAQFRERLVDHKAQLLAEKQAKLEAPMSEARWFYLRGLRLRQQGEEEAAKALWRELIDSFRDVKAEQPWVRLAEHELAHPAESAGAARWRTVRAALNRAGDLRKDNKQDEANTIYDNLERLYRDDPSAGPILDEIKRER
ncbi:MAG TPA: protein kinase, partial [Gemmataceae bacterium]